MTGEAGEWSRPLRDFVAELPLERESIATFVSSEAAKLAAGTRVLDAGSGVAPYRGLFEHCEYVTADWENSSHTTEGHQPEIVSPADNLELPDGSFEVVLCTQVLEHVPNPSDVLREFARVLVPEGRLLITVPLVWWLHEEPYDFYRYTTYGLRHLLESADFIVESLLPRNGYFCTMAMLSVAAEDSLRGATGSRALRARIFARLLRGIAFRAREFDDLDVERTFPLGYQCVARSAALRNG